MNDFLHSVGLQALSLQGFGPLLAQGTWMTLKLALLSLGLSLLLGLLGAILSVPAGQLEAATAYGLSRTQRFRLVLFPQLMRFALPGLGNNWLVLLKSTALVSIIGLADLVKAAQNAGKSTNNVLYFLIIAGLVYLLITTLSNRLFTRLERRFNTGIKGLAS